MTKQRRFMDLPKEERIIRKEDSWSGDCELLPDAIDTVIWEYCNAEIGSNPNKLERQILLLYTAIEHRSNHYQLNTPPAYGDPDYARKVAYAQGLMDAMEVTEDNEGDLITFRTASNRMLFAVETLKKPISYYEAVRENRKMMNDIFG